LGYTTVRLLRAGQLTIDRERAKAHGRTLHAIAQLRAGNQDIPEDLSAALDRFADIRYFFVPLGDAGTGEIVSTLPGENPYDFGVTGNWQAVMGKGLGWTMPWKAIKKGMGDEILNWPISTSVRARLIAEAKSRHGRQAEADSINA